MSITRLNLALLGVIPVLLLLSCGSTAQRCNQDGEALQVEPYWPAKLVGRLPDVSCSEIGPKVVCAGALGSGEIAVLVSGFFVEGNLVPGYVAVFSTGADGLKQVARHRLPPGRDFNWAEWDGNSECFFAPDNAAIIGPVLASNNDPIPIIDIPAIDVGYVLAGC